MPEALIDAGHANENDRQLVAIMVIAEEFERGRSQAFGFVDDQQLDPPGHVTDVSAGDLADAALVLVDADPDPDL